MPGELGVSGTLLLPGGGTCLSSTGDLHQSHCQGSTLGLQRLLRQQPSWEVEVPPFSLAREEDQVPTGPSLAWGRGAVFSMVFGWSRAVLARKFSVLGPFPDPLARENSFPWVHPVSHLPCTSTCWCFPSCCLQLRNLKQSKNSGKSPGCHSLGAEVPPSLSESYVSFTYNFQGF